MHTCNACNGTTWEVLERMAGTAVVRCACDLVFVTPIPSRLVIQQAYDDAYYKPWQAQSNARRKMWRRRVEIIDRLCPQRGRLLDVGCGEGTFLRAAQESGWKIAGTELSAFAVEAADDLNVRHGEIWEAQLLSESVDLVTSWHVIEHVSNPRRVIEEMYRVLCPNGWLVLATPNLHDYVFQAAYLMARGRRPTLFEPDERELHLYHFSAATLSRFVTAAGFTDVRVEFDRGAAAVWSKRAVNAIAYGWFRLTGLNWGIGLQLIARKPGADELRAGAKR
ncbi:MAG: class I SAM-dependent methyltransferase [Nitrospiraceae bacterium]